MHPKPASRTAQDGPGASGSPGIGVTTPPTARCALCDREAFSAGLCYRHLRREMLDFDHDPPDRYGMTEEERAEDPRKGQADSINRERDRS